MTAFALDPYIAALCNGQPDPRPTIAGLGRSLSGMLVCLAFSSDPATLHAFGWPPAIISAWVPYVLAEREAASRRGARSAEDAARLARVAEFGGVVAAHKLGSVCAVPTWRRPGVDARRAAVRGFARAAGIPRLDGALQAAEVN